VGWLALLLVLLLEQVRPVPGRNPVYAGAEWIADGAERNLNAGSPRHGLFAWLLVVGGATAAAGVLYAIALSVSWFLALALNLVVLYFTLGFRQFSHPFTEIQIAIANGDLATARRELTAWKSQSEEGYSAADLDASEVVRQAIEYGIVLAHRHVFGVFFWFVVLPGPMGPVFYRLADYVARRWNRRTRAPLPTDEFGRFAREAFAWIDWLPARMTALGFAIVGDFEGAVYCWRKVKGVGGFPGVESRAVVLGAASGALGARIMGAAESARYFDEPGQEGAGLREPDSNTPRSVVGLAWRAMILWLIVLLALSLAGWLA
jgi:adenosylcobinamide-phosphate synthase